jgi:hypothetical protein
MGSSLSWLACNGKTPEAVHLQLGCSSIGEFGDYPNFALVGRTLPSGWFLLVANRCGAALVSDSVLSIISSDCSFVACSIEEHVNYVVSSSWRNGRKIWVVEHFGDRGSSDLTVSGEPPSELLQIRERCSVEQATQPQSKHQVDYIFDIPLELAKCIIGFRHDEITPDIERDSFEIFALTENGLLEKLTKPWWRFW